MLEVYKQIARAADSSAPVLIQGESGTGKELVARAIHAHGRRGSRPFVAVNCGAIAETLLDSELFGHTRGSFTGAVADRRGLFEQAGDGTIFLDEIGETTPALQVKLLRVLEENEVRPVGAARVVNVAARIVAASNVDLERGGGGRPVSSGSVLSPERDRDRDAAAARAARRHPAADRAVPRSGLHARRAGGSTSAPRPSTR